MTRSQGSTTSSLSVPIESLSPHKHYNSIDLQVGQPALHVATMNGPCLMLPGTYRVWTVLHRTGVTPHSLLGSSTALSHISVRDSDRVTKP